MRVVEVQQFGGPDELTVVEVADPVPGPGEVVITVAVADVLWLETMIRRGNGGDVFPVQPPYRPGVGVAGTVSQVGAQVDPAWQGRRVLSRSGGNGGYAERALEPVSGLIPVPDGLDLSVAAALLHDGTTALTIADLVAAGPGDQVLVTAAGGGLGLLLVQLARAAGATVVAAARGEKKLTRLRDLGVDLAVDYSKPGWTDEVRAATGGLDVVLDGAGGAYGRAAYELVLPGGRFSAHGMPGGGFAVPDPADARARGITVTGIQHVQLDPEQFAATAARALEEARAGRLVPLIGQTFDLDHAGDAHAAIENRTAVGKTLLMV